MILKKKHKWLKQASCNFLAEILDRSSLSLFTPVLKEQHQTWRWCAGKPGCAASLHRLWTGDRPAGWPVTRVGLSSRKHSPLHLQITKSKNRHTLQAQKPRAKANQPSELHGDILGTLLKQISFTSIHCQMSVLTQKNMNKTPVSGPMTVK